VQEFDFLGESEVCGRSYCVPVPPVVAIDFDGYVRRGQLFCPTGFVEPNGSCSFVK